MLVKSLTLLRAQKRERICRKELLVLSYFEKLYHFEVINIMPFWQWYNAIFPKLLEFASKMLLSMHFYVIYCTESFIAKKIF